jgi:hypothetical protein
MAESLLPEDTAEFYVLSNYQLTYFPLLSLVFPLTVRIIGSASLAPCFERVLDPALDHTESSSLNSKGKLNTET